MCYTSPVSHVHSIVSLILPAFLVIFQYLPDALNLAFVAYLFISNLLILSYFQEYLKPQLQVGLDYLYNSDHSPLTLLVFGMGVMKQACSMGSTVHTPTSIFCAFKNCHQ